MKRRHIHNFGRNGIFPHKTLQEAEKALLLVFFRHVDKVNQDQTGNPAQADLAGDFAGCLLVYAVQKRIFTRNPPEGSSTRLSSACFT